MPISLVRKCPLAYLVIINVGLTVGGTDKFICPILFYGFYTLHTPFSSEGVKCHLLG